MRQDPMSKKQSRVDKCYPNKKLLPGRPKFGLNEQSFIDDNPPQTENEERKNLRKKRILDSSVEEESITESVVSSRPQLTADEIKEHYGNCIRLAAENKITSKNAFHLHLIDFLTDMLMRDDLDSFQMASSSLDASAKIYAGRVDRVHLDTYKILSDLGRTRKDEADVTEEEEEDSILDTTQEAQPEIQPTNSVEESQKRHVMRSKKKSVILTNTTRIRQKYSTLKCETDPLFQAQAIAYDEGSTSAIRINQIFTLSDSGELALDSTSKPIGTLPPAESNKEKLYSLPQRFFEIFQKQIIIKNLCPQICPEFRAFQFDYSEVPAEDVNISFEIKQSKKASRFQPAELFIIEDDDDDPEDVNSPFDICLNSQLSEANSSQSFVQDDGHKLVEGLHHLMSQQINECGAVADNMLGSWDGIKNRKLLPRENCQTNLLPTASVRQGGKQDQQNLYEDIQTFIDSPPKSQFSRVARNPKFNEFFKCDSKSNKTVMTDTVINGNFQKFNLLPELSWTELQELNRFNQLESKEVKVPIHPLYQHDPSSMQSIDLRLDSVIDQYSHNVDIDLNLVSLDERIDSPDDNDYEPTLFHQLTSPNASTIELTAQPIIKGFHKQNLDIPFARVAKSINLRRLKLVIWKLISLPYPDTMNSSFLNDSFMSSTSHNTSVSTSVSNSKSMYSNRSVMNTTSLSLVISDIPQQLPPKMASQLSVPIILSCLLHLANENDLTLESSPDLDDISITQGQPQFDTTITVESTRKRKSATCNGEIRKKKRHSSPIKGLSNNNHVVIINEQEEEDEEVDIELLCHQKRNKTGKRVTWICEESERDNDQPIARQESKRPRYTPHLSNNGRNFDNQQPCCSKSLITFPTD